MAVPANVFSATDQVYIQEWAAVQDFMSAGGRIVGDQIKRRLGILVASSPPVIKLDNRTNLALRDVKVDYCMCVKIHGRRFADRAAVFLSLRR